MAYAGVVTAFYPHKGYGFLACEETQELFGKDVFVPGSFLPGQFAKPGDQVTFNVKQTKKGPVATGVKITSRVRGRQHLSGAACVADAEYIGIIKCWNSDKGRGFILCEQLERDVFFGKPVVQDQFLWPGMPVRFTIKQEYKGPAAASLEPYQHMSSIGGYGEGYSSFGVEGYRDLSTCCNTMRVAALVKQRHTGKVQKFDDLQTSDGEENKKAKIKRQRSHKVIKHEKETTCAQKELQQQLDSWREEATRLHKEVSSLKEDLEVMRGGRCEVAEEAQSKAVPDETAGRMLGDPEVKQVASSPEHMNEKGCLSALWEEFKDVLTKLASAFPANSATLETPCSALGSARLITLFRNGFAWLNELCDHAARVDQAVEALKQLLFCRVKFGCARKPLLGPDGQTYEEEAILKWLHKNPRHPTSPLTRQLMRPEQLLRNRPLEAVWGILDLLCPGTSKEQEDEDEKEQELLVVAARREASQLRSAEASVAEQGPEAVEVSEMGEHESEEAEEEEEEGDEEEGEHESSLLLLTAIGEQREAEALDLLQLPLPLDELNGSWTQERTTFLHMALIRGLPRVALALLARSDFTACHAFMAYPPAISAFHLAAAMGNEEVCEALLARLSPAHVLLPTGEDFTLKLDGVDFHFPAGFDAIRVAKHHDRVRLVDRLQRAVEAEGYRVYGDEDTEELFLQFLQSFTPT